MKKRFLFVFLIFFGIVGGLSAQTVPEQKPNEAEVAARKRWIETLRHPTGVITIRLAALGPEPGTTPPPYTVDSWLHFQFFESQNSGEDLKYYDYRNPYYAYRPELIRDGDILPYTKQAQESVERAERQPGGDGFSSAPETMTSGKEHRGHDVYLESWYETPPQPGRYQLIVRKQYLYDGDWVESNPVTFVVASRQPATAIPDSFTVRLVPELSKEQRPGQVYKLGYNDGLRVELVNDSDQRVPVSVIDKYYGQRPQLTKDDKVIPYRADIVKLIESKEKDGRLVDVVNPFFLDPRTTQRLDGFSLKQWYGPLEPGIYHLTYRRRFEIGGPWTKDSAEFIFEIAP